MTNCRVSVILPLKDYTPFLEESLKSTVSCLKPEMELILVDDRMDPDCMPVLKPHLSHPKVTLKKANGTGIVNALHTGLSLAKGLYIARMDADDFCMGDRFTLKQEYLDRHSFKEGEDYLWMV
ncbi:glycosyltransferase family A protein [Cyclobacterium salsum]|uniref:glycosyltransferase family A protein n=1 Tax=Cyclobacterium salsum TaxID=2666329 RepID=UPI001390FF74|nr:glycosyltransferase family A protein [Cyclobacterium salsum]